VTLTTRLSLFFLGTLALVLAGFSGALYLLAQSYLHRQADERLQAAVNTLTAVAEIDPDGVEWNPAARPMAFGPGTPAGEVVWVVSDDRGHVRDRSNLAATQGFLDEVAGRLRPAEPVTGQVDWRGEGWHVSQRWLRPGPVPGKPASKPDPDDEPKYPALAITAGVPVGPIHATLRRVALTLGGAAACVWLLALAVGRAVCRRALRPVHRMAEAAREVDAADPDWRLPVPSTGDELADLSRSFNGLLDRLHEALSRQQRFTGDASHQLRTPLTALLGQLEVALRRERDADDYRRVLTSAHQQAAHLRQIVEALLFLARADAEARAPGGERVALETWLEEHLRLWSGHERAGDLRLVRDAGPPPHVQVQSALLGELVDILLDNACKYSPPGSPITVRLSRGPGEAVLEVADQGGGIAAEDLPHVCEPFFRSAEARRHGVAGVGLGLAIAKRLAEAFGGRLAVTSEAGQGSTFTVILPEAAAGEAQRLDPAPAG
jgi:signal transduction histidine kinase